jgi:hypothetical protein
MVNAWPSQPSPTTRRTGELCWPRRWSLELLVGALVIFLSWQAAVVWNEMRRDITHYPEALYWAIGVEPRGGYTKVTTKILNRRQPGRLYIGGTVDYVGKDSVSTGPFVVSIDAINAHTFSAVALGDNRRCYAELSHTYGPDQRYGWTSNTTLKPGVPCQGAAVSISTFTNGREPR